MIKILFVCHGNICRSTMAQSLFTYLVREAGLEQAFCIESAATSREEIGNPPHPGTVRQLRREGIPVVPHQAVQMTKRDYARYDLLIGMDEENLYYMRRIAGGDPDHKICKLMAFAAGPDAPEEPGGAWVSKGVSKQKQAAGSSRARKKGRSHTALSDKPSAGGSSHTASTGNPNAKNNRECFMNANRHVPDVADPWYTGDFAATYRDCLAGCSGLLDWVVQLC